MSSGQEIKIYDDTRDARFWYQLMKPTECAVLLTFQNTTTPLSPDGARYSNSNNATCILFERFEDARKFCELKVQQYPFMHCEIFDSAGRAKPPLLIVMHPSLEKRDEGSDSSKHKRRIIAFCLVLSACVLFWIDWRVKGVWVVPTFLGINMILAALRILHFNLWSSNNDEEREERVIAHLKREDHPPQN